MKMSQKMHGQKSGLESKNSFRNIRRTIKQKLKSSNFLNSKI